MAQVGQSKQRVAESASLAPVSNPVRNLSFQAGQKSTRRDARSGPYSRQQGGCLPGMKGALVKKHLPGRAPVGHEFLGIPIQSVNVLIQTWLSHP